ncbi:MAG TPA: hypothetical protein EYP59_08235 [Thiotrichaceae bacterium]|nr:hypothetical protein [Thiotrichaceae bacterium]
MIYKEVADSYEAQLRNQKGWVSERYYSKINNLQLKRIQALKPKQSMKDLPEELQHSSSMSPAFKQTQTLLEELSFSQSLKQFNLF